MRTTDYGLRTTDYGLQATDYRLRTTDYRLRTTDYGLQTTDYRLQREAEVGQLGWHAVCSTSCLSCDHTKLRAFQAADNLVTCTYRETHPGFRPPNA